MDNQAWGYVVGWTVIATFFALVSYALWMNDSRHVERAMAKKLERKRMADLVSAAIEDGFLAGTISAKERHKYNKKLAYALGLPDMVPKKKFNLKLAIRKSKKRLDAMGVNIAHGLKHMRRRRPTKKETLLRLLKKS